MDNCTRNISNMSNLETDISNTNGLPISGNPLWAPLWDAKAACFNTLAEQMEKAGIDIQFLIDYRSAMEALTKLEAQHAHDNGFILGALAMTTPEKEGAVNA